MRWLIAADRSFEDEPDNLPDEVDKMLAILNDAGYAADRNEVRMTWRAVSASRGASWLARGTNPTTFALLRERMNDAKDSADALIKSLEKIRDHCLIFPMIGTRRGEEVSRVFEQILKWIGGGDGDDGGAGGGVGDQGPDPGADQRGSGDPAGGSGGGSGLGRPGAAPEGG